MGFCARGVQMTARTPCSSAARRPCDRHALVVDGHRHRAVAGDAHGVDAREEARVFEGDGVVAGEGLGEQALDGVAGAARHGEVHRDLGRQVGAHPLLRPPGEVGIDDGLAVQHRAPGDAREGVRRVGDSRGIGVARADVAERRVGGEALLGDRGTAGHASAASAEGDHDAGVHQLPVGRDRGVPVHAEMLRQRADRGECVAGAEGPALDERAQAVGDLRR